MNRQAASVVSAAYGMHPGPPPERGEFPQAIDGSAVYETVNREFSCGHSEVQLCVTVSVRGSRSYRNQCLRCGQTASHAKVADLPEHRKQDAVEFDNSIRTRWYEAKSERSRQLEAEAQSRLDSLRDEEDRRWDRWYRAYLASFAWRQRRSAVLQRDEFTCQGCLAANATQVHHLTYDHVGNELLFELVSVCDECHRKAHPDKA